VWALTNGGQSSKNELKHEFKHLESLAVNSTDPYFLGLYAGSLANVNETEDAELMANDLILFQNDSGALVDASSSITRSQGKNLVVETTSVALLTWI